MRGSGITQLFLLCFSLLLFLGLLGKRDIVISHEGRVAQVARVMSSSGSPFAAKKIEVPTVAMKDIGGGAKRLAPTGEGTFTVNPWLVPILNGEIRLQKPPLPYWASAICFKLFGVSEFAARLAPALLGALATLLIFDLAKLLYGPRVALFSALAWLSTYFVIDEFRKAMADPYLAFCALLGTWALITSLRTKSFQPLRIILFYLAIALGMLAKGPLIFLWLAIAIGSYLIASRNSNPISHGLKARATPRVIAHLLGVILAIVIGGAWYLYIYLHVPHALDLWRYESIGELAGNPENVREWWFYFPNLFLIILPWILAAFVGAMLALRERKRRLFPLLWFVVALIFFSFVHQKKNPYLLPAAPALAILIGQGIVTLRAAARRGHHWAGILAGAQAVIGLAFAIVTCILLAKLALSAIAFAIIATIIAVVPLIRILRHRPMRWAAWQPFAYSAVIFVFLNFYFTTTENSRSPRLFMQHVAQYITDHDGNINRASIPEDAAFYFPLDFPETPSNELYVVVDDRRNEIQADPAQLQSLAEGKKILTAKQIEIPGPRRWKLFELTVANQ